MSTKHYPPGLYLDSGEFVPADQLERQEPLPTPFSAEEYMQKLPSPWTGLNIALALVLAAAVSGLLLDAAARAGWL